MIEDNKNYNLLKIYMDNNCSTNILKQYKGYFWLPENEEKDVPGILTRYSNQKIELELFGSFFSDEKNRYCDFSPQKTPKRVIVIHGLDSDAKKISLYAIRKSASLNLSCPFPIIKYRIIYMVYGKHIDDFEKSYRFEAEVEIPELSAWCPAGLIEHKFQFGNDGIERIIIESNVQLSKTPIHEQTLENGVVLKLCGDCYSEQSQCNIKPILSQSTKLTISNEKGISVKEILNITSKFERFISFASQIECNYSEIKLLDGDTTQTTRDGIVHFLPIYLYAERFCNDKIVVSPNYLFYYNDIKENFNTIINNWLSENEDWPIVLEHLVDSVILHGGSNSTWFMTVIQGVDGFWQRFREEIYRAEKNIKTRISLAEELSVLKKEYSDMFGKSIFRSDNKSIKDTRDFYSHLLKENSERKILQGVELYTTTCELKKLLIYCVMKETGFNNSAIKRALEEK